MFIVFFFYGDGKFRLLKVIMLFEKLNQVRLILSS